DPRTEARIARGLDDFCELGPVVSDQAPPLDRHVVDEPVVAPAEHPVDNRYLGPLLGNQLRADGREVAVDLIAEIRNALAVVELDLADVRTLQQIGEEPGKLIPLHRGARLPVRPKGPLRRLREVEDLVGDSADRGAPLRRTDALP